MAAPKGHPLWGNPLNPKKYTPETLWDKAVEYFEWCNKNPIKIIEQSKMPQRLPSNYSKETHGSIKQFTKQTIELPHQRAYSIEGFCCFANISFQTFRNYESKETEKDGKVYENKDYITFLEVCKRIREIINYQHFSGGMAGIFNANIVTRKLGLSEKLDHGSSDGSMSPKPTIVVQSGKAKKDLDNLVNGNN